MRNLIAVAASLVVSGAALAQAPAMSSSTTTSTHAATTVTTAPADKTTISKACSDQANAKGLHGKDRKKFRSECKHGKA